MQEKCTNKGWIHQVCDETILNLNQFVLDSEDFKFVCKSCKGKNNKKKGKKKTNTKK